MITVTLDHDGKGSVGLPSNTIPIDESTPGAARSRIIDHLLTRAARHAVPLQVTALDKGSRVDLTVYPDGRVDVDPHPPAAVAPVLASQRQLELIDTADAPYAARPAITHVNTTAPDSTRPTLTESAHAPTAPVVIVQELPPEVEATRIVSRRAARAGAILTFSTGDFATVTGSALVGRHPVLGPDETVDHIVTLNDPTRSISSTHFAIAWHNGQLHITDRGSANGTTVVRPNQDPAPLPAGLPYLLRDGDRVEIGDHSFTVRTTDRTI